MTKKMVTISYNHPFLRFPQKKILTIVKKVFEGEKKKKLSLTIIFTNNNHIKEINKKYLKHNYITDVIAFSFGNGYGTDAEIYVNLDVARKQAKEYNVTFTNEVSRLIIHGLLHIIGYDDSSSIKRKKMVKKENKYLERIFLTKGLNT